MLDDTPKVVVPPIPHDVQQPQQKLPHTPVNVRQSTRTSRPPEIFSPTLYSIFLTDAGELECYDEVVQVKRLYRINRFIGSKKRMEVRKYLKLG